MPSAISTKTGASTSDYEIPVDGKSPLIALDLDGYGFPEVATVSEEGDAAFLPVNDGTGKFAFHYIGSVVTYQPQALVGGDLNGDGGPDLSVGGVPQIAALLNRSKLR